MTWRGEQRTIYTERKAWGDVRGTIEDRGGRDDRFVWVVTLGAFRVSGSCDGLGLARRQAEAAASLLAAVKGTP